MSWDSARPALPHARTWERSNSVRMLEPCGPKAVALYHYWNARRGLRAMPSRADIDPTEMRQWLPRITLVDVSSDGRNFTYRLVGTRMVDLLGADPTGQPVESAWPQKAAAIVLADYREVVETKAPVFCHQTCAWLQDQGPSAWAMRLPLSSDGNEVDVVLGYLSDNIGMLSQF
ncbi:MAG: PAS domain-containing protein [Dongiaceae bacterium]